MHYIHIWKKPNRSNWKWRNIYRNVKNYVLNRVKNEMRGRNCVKIIIYVPLWALCFEFLYFFSFAFCCAHFGFWFFSFFCQHMCSLLFILTTFLHFFCVVIFSLSFFRFCHALASFVYFRTYACTCCCCCCLGSRHVLVLSRPVSFALVIVWSAK